MGSQGRLRVIIEGYIPVDDLSDYHAACIHVAAKNQQKWHEEGDMGISELLSYTDAEPSVRIEGEEPEL